MNRRQMLATSAAALALGGAFGPARAAGVSAEEIVVGMHLDLSGPAAAGMPMLRQGTEMAIARANEAGGIHGRRIRLVIEDNGSQPQLAVRVVQKMIRSDQVFALLNCFGSGTNAATIGAAVGAGTVVFAPWAASAVMHQVAKNSPLLFTTVPNYDTTTRRALERMIPQWGVRRVGVIYMEGPFGDLIRAGVNPALETLGMTVAAEAAYRPGEIDFSSHVARMRAADVDLIVAGTIIRETIGVMSEVRKLGWDVRVLTALPGRGTIVARLGGAEVEGLYGIGGWYLHGPDSTDPELRAFRDGFRDRFGAEADENAANAFSYANWFLDALRAAGRELDAERFVAAARATTQADFTTYAPLSFVDNHAMPELVSIDRIVGGRWIQEVAPF
ncbi:MAG: hypothetical protein KatS3mg118_3676 [Paracoccaceae bacterium]|nr:MAG: hypothetical protein KatS3mg118_3676 [Paracoccaceae bacterium]